MCFLLNQKIFLLLLLFFCLYSGCSNNTPPELRALELVKNSHVVNKDFSIDRIIKDFIKEKGDEVKPVGWRVEKMADNRYLASYIYNLHSFKEGVGERGFFFEVDLAENSVTDKTIESTEKMPPLTKAYSDENEIFKDITGQAFSTDTIQE